LTGKEAIQKFASLEQSYKKQVLEANKITGSQEKMVILHTIEKYVSVVTAMARVKWTYEKDFKEVELLMAESLNFLSSIIDRVATNAMGIREPMVQKLTQILKVN
jgi:hypothetical protein